MIRSFVLALALLVTTGCLTHVPVSPAMPHLGIHWVNGFGPARAKALAEGKPLLVILAAGERDGLC